MLLDLAFSVWVVYSQLQDSFFKSLKSRLNRIDISVKYSMISERALMTSHIRVGRGVHDSPQKGTL